MSGRGQLVVEFDDAVKAFVERRGKRRVQVSVPIVVRGVDSQGNRFQEATESVNFSASGTCISLQRRIKVGSFVQLSISLPPDLKTYESLGQVKRVEALGRQPGYRFGIHFTHRKTKINKTAP